VKPTLSIAPAFLATVLACRSPEPDHVAAIDSAPANASPVVDTGFATVAESAWVNVKGFNLIGFYPIRTNDQLEKDADLATVLDDFAYHIGTAMDSLIAEGFTVDYRGGDTLWMRTGTDRWRFVRPTDSSDVGYVFTDSLGRVTAVYGVRTYMDLIEYVHEYRRTGQIRPR
jgi:hypothetical protein